MRKRQLLLADNRRRPTDNRAVIAARFSGFRKHTLSLLAALVCLAMSARSLTALSPELRPPELRHGAFFQQTSSGQMSPSQTVSTPSEASPATPTPSPRIRPPQLDPNASPEKLEEEADVLRAQKFFADALDRYLLALRKGRDTARIHNKIGITEMRLQHYDESRREFERAVRRDNHYAEAYNNLGAMEYFRQNYRRAIGDYQHAIKLEPNSAAYHSNLASAYFNRKEMEKAIAEYALALKLDPTIFEHYSGMGNTISPIVSTQNRAEYDYTIAKIFAKAGDLDHCLDYLKKAMEEDGEMVARIKKDAEFSSLRQNPRFVALLSNPPTPLPR